MYFQYGAALQKVSYEYAAVQLTLATGGIREKGKAG